MVQPIILGRVIVEPGAIAGSPAGAAYHAELSPATTCHVIAAFFEFDHGLASEATLPSLVLGLCHKPQRFLVLGAVPTTMPPAVAAHTNLCPTLIALAILLPVVGVTDILGADELVAALLGAVDAVAGRILDELLIPGPLEIVVKQAVHVFQGDGGRGATLGWHVLWVCNGQLEASLEARVAHPVAAFKLGRLPGGEVVPADDTFHYFYTFICGMVVMRV